MANEWKRVCRHEQVRADALVDIFARGNTENHQLRVVDTSDATGLYSTTITTPTSVTAPPYQLDIVGAADEEELNIYMAAALGMAALWFLYTHVLARSKVVLDLPHRKTTRRLPVVPTPAEVEQLFATLHAPTTRAVLMLAYGAGLRVGEACRLRVQDVDSRAGVIHVPSAKRNRDRDVMLSAKLLAELRAY
jgi:integrase